MDDLGSTMIVLLISILALAFIPRSRSERKKRQWKYDPKHEEDFD